MWRVLTLFLLVISVVAVAQDDSVPPPSPPVFTTITSPGATPDTTSWALPDSTYEWSFPRDHWPHPEYRNEWWYVVGQLSAKGETRPRYGFQLTLFRIGILPFAPGLNSDFATRGMVMGHLAVTDLAEKRHVFSEILAREMPLWGGFASPAENRIAWARAPAGTDGIWEFGMAPDSGFVVRARDASKGIALELELHAEGRPVLQGPNGLSVKNSSGTAASLYYSMPRLRTVGTIVSGGKSLPVSGLSWLDREWSSVGLGSEQAGWDWFSLQLTDGRALMLYRLRGKNGAADFGRATLVDSLGVARYLAFDEWTITPRGTWKSPHTKAEYPLSWTVSVFPAGMAFDVEPLVDDQENIGDRSGVAYWEGAIVARDQDGREIGRGYLELTGYGGSKARPQL
jgi:predicted secreted hydrolase